MIPTLKWGNRGKELDYGGNAILTQTDGTLLSLPVGTCIEFKRSKSIASLMGKPELENTTILCKILGFGFSGRYSPPQRIFYLPYRVEEKRWASPSFMQRELYNEEWDSIKIIEPILD